jgi:hypothetical protein
MCCRVVVTPIPAEVLDLLLLAGFHPYDATLRSWTKQLPDGSVRVARNEDSLEFTLLPAISAMDHHEMVQVAAACMFKVADRFAEAANGTITHLSNIGLCAAERGGPSAVIAAYPRMPLRFERLCLGFKQLFGRELDRAA